MRVADGLTVGVLPNEAHGYLMATKEVARGYGVSEEAVRMTLKRHRGELVEGKHFLKGVTKCYASNGHPHHTFWTKRGIVRLGFFIRSERARLFRDWAEDLVIAVDAQRDLFGNVSPQGRAAIGRNRRWLTKGRLMRLLAQVAKIDDGDVRREVARLLTEY